MAGRSTGLALPARPLTTTLTVGARGSAPADEVWLRYATPARWHEWSPQIAAVHCEHPDDVVEHGRAGTVDGPFGVRVSFRVRDVDLESRRWTWCVRVGMVDLTMEHGVDAGAPAGVRGGRGRDARTRAWVAITGPLPLVVAYAPAARLALGRLVAPT